LTKNRSFVILKLVWCRQKPNMLFSRLALTLTANGLALGEEVDSEP
jgi:hypothetical protein